MKIAGLQKLTLLDYPGKTACTVFTGGCNFRCPFCHNASLVFSGEGNEELGQEEFFSFLKKRKGILDGVAVTGGEPLLHADIPAFLKQIRSLGYPVKLDTNGSRPELLEELVREGLVNYVAMDIKNSPETYPVTVGIRDFDLSAVSRSKDFLLRGTVPYEFRTTVVKGLHTEESMRGLAEWIRGAEQYWLQTFRDSGELIAGEGLDAFSEEEMKRFAEMIRPSVPSVRVRGVSGG